jgi:flagellin
MSIRVNYNPMSVLTNANLGRSERAMSKALDRLSSGLRIQRSADDPGSMVLANAVRYARVANERAGSNAEEMVSLLQTAEGGMDQITQVLQRMRTLALGAMNEATQDPSQLAALQVEMDTAIASITTISTTTTYGSVNLLQGSLADSVLSDQAKSYYDAINLDHRALTGGIQAGSDITFEALSGPLQRTQQPEFFGAGTPDDTLVGGPGVMTLSGPKGTTQVAVGANMTIAGAVSAINAATSTTGILAGYDEATGQMTLENSAYGSGLISATSDVPGFLFGSPIQAVDQIFQLDYVDGQGATQTVLMVQDPNSSDGLTFTNIDGGPELPPGPYTGFQPGAFSVDLKDTSAGGIGATIVEPPPNLTATRTSSTAMQLGILSSQRVQLEIPDMRAGALGHAAGLANQGLASLQDLVTDQSLINGRGAEALQLIDAALNEVNRARGATGSLQGNMVERVMDSLRVSHDNLAQYESILRDADMAAESAEFARVQIMIQAATAMLAQANQVPQSVLQLLR